MNRSFEFVNGRTAIYDYEDVLYVSTGRFIDES